MRKNAWLPLLLLGLGLCLAPAAQAAPSGGQRRKLNPNVMKRLKAAKAAKAAEISKEDRHCSEGELCRVHEVDTVFGFSKTFVDVHKHSSVMLAIGDDNHFEGFCSGTLLGPNTIVTASHCFDHSRDEGTNDEEVRVVWNYHKEDNGNWAWPRYVGRVMKVTKKFDKSKIDLAVATVRWKCGQLPPVAAPPGPKVSADQKVISFQHPKGHETHVASGRVENTDEHRADDYFKGAEKDSPQVYAWAKMKAYSNGSGGGVFGPSGGLVGVVYRSNDYLESGFVQIWSVRDQVPRLNQWANGHKLVADVAAGAAACIR